MSIQSSNTSTSVWRRWVADNFGGGSGEVAYNNGDGTLGASANLTFDGNDLSIVGQGHIPTITLTDGATINWDMNNGSVAKVTLGGARTMAAPTNLKDGGTYLLRIIQDGTGSRTITWNSVFKWSGGTAPTLSTGAGAIDIISFTSDGTNLYGSAVLNFS